MCGEQAKEKLNELYLKGRQQCIALICYCDDEKLCHRKIVLGLLQGAYMENGLQVRCKGSDFVQDDYSDYYAQYKNLKKI